MCGMSQTRVSIFRKRLPGFRLVAVAGHAPKMADAWRFPGCAIEVAVLFSEPMAEADYKQ